MATIQGLEYWIITGANDDELREIIELYCENDWWDDDADLPLLTRIIEGSHAFAIAKHDGKIVGMARAISDFASDAYIQDVAVTKEYRRQGIAKALLNKVIEHLNNDGIYWIATISANRSTAPVYSSVGFRGCPGEVSMEWDPEKK